MNRTVTFFYLLLSLLFSGHLWAQNEEPLSPEQKAYLYYTIGKSPILEQHLGRFFDYTGQPIRLANGNVNYDSTAQYIIAYPDSLIIYHDELRKAPRGLISELTNKMALWELNMVLTSKRNNELEKDGYSDLYHLFLDFFVRELPDDAFLRNTAEKVLYPKMETIFHPGLALTDKVAILDGINQLTIQDKMKIINALTFATNQYLKLRTFSFYKSIGGDAENFTNVIAAAGDGANNSEFFEEREKDERSRWNKGLPKAIGLFPYSISLIDEPSRKVQTLQPERYSIHQFETAGMGKMTNVHIDVWGYSKDRQTTIVIDKGGAVYPLFGNLETRFLSPDSSFKGGLTYSTLIRRLEKDVAALEELISGKKGFDYWIAYHEKKKKNKLLQIDKIEKELSDMRMQPITTTTKGKKKKKKLVADSNQKNRHPKQETFLRYYAELAAINKKIKELNEQRDKAIHDQQILIQRVKFMYDLIGSKWMSFKEKDGLYVFSDSATFDIQTQEFTFPVSDSSETFEIRLIAIPDDERSSAADEVMIHMNVMETTPIANASIQLVLNKFFEEGKINLPQQIFFKKDSLSQRIFLESMLENKKPFEISVVGGGKGLWNGYHVIPQLEINRDEQKIKRTVMEQENLNAVQIYGFTHRRTKLEIQCFTGNFDTGFSNMSAAVQAKMRLNKWSENDVLSAYQARAILLSLQNEFNQFANDCFEPKEAKIISKRLNKAIAKTRIEIGKGHLTLKEM